MQLNDGRPPHLATAESTSLASNTAMHLIGQLSNPPEPLVRLLRA